MKTLYLSHFLDNNTPSYADRDEVRITPKSEISKGETANTSEIVITNNHIGTHIDVPKHFYDDGDTYSDISPDNWFFSSVSLIDIPIEKGRLITTEDFESSNIPQDVDFLIIRTGFENKRYKEPYWSAYPGIDPVTCEYLRKNYPDLRAVGFDFISLTSPLFKEEGKAAHRVFLDDRDGEYVFIIEDMKIGELSQSDVIKNVIIAPLLVENGNGGPVTIIAHIQ